MHERIKELAEEATRKYDRLGNEIPFAQPDLELFAKLIIKECLSKIDEIRDGCEFDGEEREALGADWAGLAVSKHFGVE